MLSTNISSTCLHITVNFGLLTAEICWRVWGTPANFNGFRVLAVLLHASSSGRGRGLGGFEQRAPPILNRAAITLGIGPHFWFLSIFCFFLAYSQRSEIGCLPTYFHTWCGLSPFWRHRTTLSGYRPIFGTETFIDNLKKTC